MCNLHFTKDGVEVSFSIDLQEGWIKNLVTERKVNKEWFLTQDQIDLIHCHFYFQTLSVKKENFLFEWSREKNQRNVYDSWSEFTMGGDLKETPIWKALLKQVTFYVERLVENLVTKEREQPSEIEEDYEKRKELVQKVQAAYEGLLQENVATQQELKTLKNLLKKVKDDHSCKTQKELCELGRK